MATSVGRAWQNGFHAMQKDGFWLDPSKRTVDAGPRKPGKSSHGLQRFERDAGESAGAFVFVG
jgi:hypothetical protein